MWEEGGYELGAQATSLASIYKTTLVVLPIVQYTGDGLVVSFIN